MSKIDEAKNWVMSQTPDIGQDGLRWTAVVDDAVDLFDVDIEALEAALCASLGLARPPASELSPDSLYDFGNLTIISDPIEVAKYRERITKGR